MTTNEHGERVDAWLALIEAGSSDAVLRAFEEALSALWRRMEMTVGSVTLAAIVDRVLHDAAVSHPAFGTLRADVAGVHFEEFRLRGSRLDERELREGSRAVLVQFLTVLGNLTADVLSDELHRELLNSTSPATAGGGRKVRP